MVRKTSLLLIFALTLTTLLGSFSVAADGLAEPSQMTAPPATDALEEVEFRGTITSIALGAEPGTGTITVETQGCEDEKPKTTLGHLIDYCSQSFQRFLHSRYLFCAGQWQKPVFLATRLACGQKSGFCRGGFSMCKKRKNIGKQKNVRLFLTLFLSQQPYFTTKSITSQTTDSFYFEKE